MNWISTLCTVVVFATIANGQRVAPGVPPQQYQAVPQHGGQQHYQQAPVQHLVQDQYGQPQYQQVPQQQVQYQQQQGIPQQHQQVHHQQQQHAPQPQVNHGGGHGGAPHGGNVPHGGGTPHGHGAPHGQQPVLNPANIQHEREHIAEHMDVPIDTSKMSDQELQFHYFKMHDSDNNNKLDGCELIKSLIHWHVEQGSKQPQDGKPKVEEKVFSDDELIALIDPILQMDDTSHDGYIDYPEFIKAQKKAAAQNKPAK